MNRPYAYNPRKKRTFTCKQCAEEFKAADRRAVYCSDQCRRCDQYPDRYTGRGKGWRKGLKGYG